MTRAEKRKRHQRRLNREKVERWNKRNPEKLRAARRRTREKNPHYDAGRRRNEKPATRQRRLARRQAKRESGRRRWRREAAALNAVRRARQVSKRRKYREAVKREIGPPIMPAWQCSAALLARLKEHHAHEQ